ncbi:MAG: class I SAM-dependent methyltransferase [Spirochaetes bacterium]|nr:class I SAM-dependent methyltransferase [Spirochaetota bacterium]
MPQADLHVYTTSHLFEKMQAVLSDLRAKNPGWRTALDVPAGAGAFTRFLAEDLNLKTEASDIDPSKWTYKKVKAAKADLGRKLPYGDRKFDLVVCLEGIKHVSDATAAIKELGRVLKPGGTLVLTIPNDLCLETRLNYFFNGFVDTDWKLMDVGDENVKSYLYVRSLVHLPYLYFFLDENNLQLMASYASRHRNFSLFLMGLLYPFIWLRTRKAIPKGHPLRQHMLSKTWLTGRHCIIVCEKRAG